MQLRYYESPHAITRHAPPSRVQLGGKGTRTEVVAKKMVDCTGNAAVIGMMGLPREREGTNQPGSLIYRLGGYDMARLDLAMMAGKAEEAVATGKLESTDFRHNLRGFLTNGGENATHLPGADSSTS